MRAVHRVSGFAVLAVLMAGCTPATTFLNPNSTIANHEATLYREVLVEAAVIFVLIVGALIWMLIRGRRPANDARPAPQIYGKISWAIGAAVLVLLADGVDYGAMALTMRDVSIPVLSSQDLNVIVTGHQWWWEFDYPDLGIKTANELHIPTGTNVHITLGSVDVIHSFWVPQLTGKTDAIPGQTNRMWLQADQPGEFLGQCSEFCGTEHAMMRIKAVAQSPADFQSWVANQQKPAAQPQTEAEQAGYKIVTTTCATCHSLNPAEPRTDMTGPNLAHLQSRSVFAGATYELTETSLRQWIQDTQSMKPGNDMNINLKSSDIDNVIAYLKLLK